MAGDGATFITRWGMAVDAFNHDDLGPFEDFFAPDCVFHTSLGTVGTNRDEILASLREGRAAGWVSHNPLQIAIGGEFMVSIFRNDYADGSSFVAGGVVRMDDEGRIAEVHTLEPLAVRAARQRSG